MVSLHDRVYGSLLGGLIGDAMGEPVEGMHYADIEAKHGWVDTFAGSGTDDSAVKMIICQALIKHGGHITADEFAESFMENVRYYKEYYKRFYVPVHNMFHKLQDELTLPIDAGYGNMQSSSSAMAISPMGIVNACNPRQAALETFEVASLIHSGPAAFCRDGACVMAAAVAEAMRPDATVDSILDAATRYLHPVSSKVMLDKIATVMAMAREAGDYKAFRTAFYEKCLYNVLCDSRETIPATLAIFYLAKGDAAQCIMDGANFGRDADTIASMVGALAGAYQGVQGLKGTWVQQLESGAAGTEQKQLTAQMIDLIRKRAAEAQTIVDFIAGM